MQECIPLPNMVAFRYTDDLKHSSIACMRSWMLLWAFGPHQLLVLPLACYNDKKFYQEILPEAICCCLQTCLLLIFILLIEYFMYTKSCSHT